MSIGYSILSILVIFKYSFDERRTNEQANNVRIFMKFENGSTIKLPLNIVMTWPDWFITIAAEKIKIIIVKKLTSLKLFLINTPIIKRNNNDIDKDNSGNI